MKTTPCQDCGCTDRIWFAQKNEGSWDVMRELDQKWGDGETVVEYAVTFWEEGIKYAVLPIREMAELTAAFLNLYAKARTNSEDNMMARLLNTVSQQLFDEEKGGEKGNHDGN